MMEPEGRQCLVEPKGWKAGRPEAYGKARVMTDRSRAGGMREPGQASGMTIHAGDEVAWSQGGADESTGRGGIMCLEALGVVRWSINQGGNERDRRLGRTSGDEEDRRLGGTSSNEGVRRLGGTSGNEGDRRLVGISENNIYNELLGSNSTSVVGAVERA